MKPRFFADPLDFRAWLQANHARADELWVGYYKKASGRGGMVYAEAVEQALCFGWIDGVVNSIDAGPLHAALHAAAGAQLLERRQHPAGQMRSSPPARWLRLVWRSSAPVARRRRAATPNENKDVTLDAAMLKRSRPTGKAWTVVRGPAAVLPPARCPLGDEREEGGDAPVPSDHAPRMRHPGSAGHPDSRAPGPTVPKTHENLGGALIPAVPVGRNASQPCVIAEATHAAPKPLSMFTTDKPFAQLFNIPSRAARPPKLAP
jgi:hypothetical protein